MPLFLKALLLFSKAPPLFLKALLLFLKAPLLFLKALPSFFKERFFFGDSPDLRFPQIVFILETIDAADSSKMSCGWLELRLLFTSGFLNLKNSYTAGKNRSFGWVNSAEISNFY